MRIAVVGTRGIPAKHGGIERHCEELYTRLADRGHDVTVFARSSYVDDDIETYKGVRIRRLGALNTKHLEAVTHTLNAALRASLAPFDIVHYHAIGPSSLIWLSRLRRRPRIVATCHGLDWQRPKWGRIATRYLQVGERASATLPDATVCVSRTLSDHYMTQYGRETVYIPNGVNAPTMRPAEEITKMFGLVPNGYLLFVGRLVPEKGVHHLIEAYRRLDSSVRLVVAGGTSHTDGYVASVRETGKSADVVFTGYAYGELLDELYSNALAFVLPSEVEGLPIGLLEAMSYCIPAVVSDISANLEIAREEPDCVSIFRCGDAQDLADKLAALVSGPVGERSLAACRDRILDRYCWDTVADRTEELYARLIADGRRSCS